MKYLNKFLIIVALVFIGCQEEVNCDLSHYPNPPFSYPDDTSYTDTSVRYLYVCYSGSYNRIVTYQVVDGCWEKYVDEDYNLNCN